eukprot:scpid52965/ scgid4462/ Protein FAM49B; L1 &gt; Protein FAM49B
MSMEKLLAAHGWKLLPLLTLLFVVVVMLYSCMCPCAVVSLVCAQQKHAQSGPTEGQSGEVVSNEMANRMSLFYANPTPMLKTVSDSTSKFVEENKDIPIENTAEVLSTLAELCRIMVETQAYRERFQSADTVLFCLQVMVGNIILYDHTQPAGAFCKKSSIDVRQCVKLLRDMQEENPAQQGAIESLINALKYTTKHLNDETTPKHFKQLLA